MNIKSPFWILSSVIILIATSGCVDTSMDYSYKGVKYEIWFEGHPGAVAKNDTAAEVIARLNGLNFTCSSPYGLPIPIRFNLSDKSRDFKGIISNSTTGHIVYLSNTLTRKSPILIPINNESEIPDAENRTAGDFQRDLQSLTDMNAKITTILAEVYNASITSANYTRVYSTPFNMDYPRIF